MLLDVLLEALGKAKHDKPLVDVSQKILGNTFPIVCTNEVNVDSNIDILVTKSKEHDITCKVFLAEKEDGQTISHDLSVNNNSLKFSIFTSKDNLKGRIVVSLPDIAVLNIHNTFSDVVVDNVFSKKICITTTSGDVNLNRSTFVDLSATTNSGDIVIELDRNDYRLTLRSSNGDIVKKGVNSVSGAEKSVSCVTKNGDICLSRKS